MSEDENDDARYLKAYSANELSAMVPREKIQILQGKLRLITGKTWRIYSLKASDVSDVTLQQLSNAEFFNLPEGLESWSLTTRLALAPNLEGHIFNPEQNARNKINQVLGCQEDRYRSSLIFFELSPEKLDKALMSLVWENQCSYYFKPISRAIAHTAPGVERTYQTPADTIKAVHKKLVQLTKAGWDVKVGDADVNLKHPKFDPRELTAALNEGNVIFRTLGPVENRAAAMASLALLGIEETSFTASDDTQCLEFYANAETYRRILDAKSAHNFSDAFAPVPVPSSTTYTLRKVTFNTHIKDAAAILGGTKLISHGEHPITTLLDMVTDLRDGASGNADAIPTYVMQNEAGELIASVGVYTKKHRGIDCLHLSYVRVKDPKYHSQLIDLCQLVGKEFPNKPIYFTLPLGQEALAESLELELKASHGNETIPTGPHTTEDVLTVIIPLQKKIMQGREESSGDLGR